MTPHPHILGVILAGGQSRRMGGGDKGLAELAGKPMLAHVVERVRPQLGQLILNANGQAGRFDVFGIDVVADPDGAGHGPLAGLLAAVRWAEENAPHIAAVASITTDVPFLPDDLIERLERGRQNACSVAQCLDQVHWAIGIWPLTLGDAMAAALAGQQRSLQAFANSSGATRVCFPPVRVGSREVDPFFNANTPDDLKFAEALLAEQKHEAQ